MCLRVFTPAVIFIFRWLNSSILLGVLCLYVVWYCVSLFFMSSPGCCVFCSYCFHIVYTGCMMLRSSYMLLRMVVCCCVLAVSCCVFLAIFWFCEKIEKMARMEEGSNYFDLIDSVDIVSTSSIVHPKCYVVGVFRYGGVGWIAVSGRYFLFDVVISFGMGSHLCFFICYCC